MSNLVFGEHLIAEEDISWVPRNEAILIIAMAFVLGLVAAAYLRSKRSEIELKGQLGKMNWIYTGTGQVAVFIAVFLAIVVAYIALRLTPGS